MSYRGRGGWVICFLTTAFRNAPAHPPTPPCTFWPVPNTAETAVHGCHCPDDTVVCMTDRGLVFKCVTCFNYLKGVTLVVDCVKCIPIPIKRKRQDEPPLRGSWKLNDPPLTKGSKTDDSPTLCSGPPPLQILFDQSLRPSCLLGLYWLSYHQRKRT